MAIIPTRAILNPPSIELDKVVFAEFEHSGGVSLTAEMRASLQRAVDVFSVLRTDYATAPRPNEVKERLASLFQAAASMEASLTAIMRGTESIDGATRNILFELSPENDHLLDDLLDTTARVKTMAAAAIEKIPTDKGGKRPSPLNGLILDVADIFEEAGGDASRPNWRSALGHPDKAGEYQTTPFVRALTIILIALRIDYGDPARMARVALDARQDNLQDRKEIFRQFAEAVRTVTKKG